MLAASGHQKTFQAGSYFELIIDYFYGFSKSRVRIKAVF